jgi:hypothetical protein
MEADDLLCSRNARSRTPLVGHAQWETHLARPQGGKEGRIRSMRAGKENLAAPLKRGEANEEAPPGLMAHHRGSIAKQSEDDGYSLLLRRVIIIAPMPNTIAKKTRTIAVNEPSTQEKLSLQKSNIYCQNPHIFV